MQIVELLKQRLQEDLPGQKAHIEMYPPSRFREMNRSRDTAKKSAVLLMLYEKNNSVYIMLIVRTKGDNAHSGQISFPGGKCEQFDENITATALREANEEIGVNIENIKVIGQLSSLFIPVSNFIVYPVVAYHTGSLELNPNHAEVSELLEIPIHSLLDSKNKIISKVNARGKIVKVPSFVIQDKIIWGATAMMINEFIYVLKK